MAILLGCSVSARAETLNVAVASNFVAAMQHIERAFEGDSQHEIRIIRGSSGKHYAQIRNGAPFDIFLSADQLRPRRLVEEGIAEESGLTTYAEGQLALWSRQNDLQLDSEYLLNTDNYRVIAIANPRLAPYGQAATEVFSYLGLESRVSERLVMGENIAQAFQFAFSGNADLGLVAYSQALSPNMRGQGSVWLVPSELHQPIKQDMVILSNSTAALEFATFMKSDVVRDILLSSGYLLPEGAP
ncbi:MAG: molybdate ABC transporter substrate-binding protein [SAR86 cluster bacterium]|uniref:Molybdate ABC transporter substrate-binding protein n=1 Tax=SAR86 cluster bacterium TaxID=2030880 RepID=A0A2A4X2L6_9GAMM|nr:MAG: molybdate ABC transporter substrate-binding protein [SAR86 cluster bacterium]